MRVTRGSPPNAVVLWTIQGLDAWETLSRTGRLRAEGRRVDPAWKPAFRWMAEQMTQRIGPPPSRARYPLWAWYRWRSTVRAMPDLRARGHLPSGMHGVRIRFSVDPARVLLSDFDAWHAVLNRWYLPASPDDELEFERRAVTRGRRAAEQARTRIERSWARIFDLERNVLGWGEDPDALAIQATLWELQLEQVEEVREFIAR